MKFKLLLIFLIAGTSLFAQDEKYTLSGNLKDKETGAISQRFVDET